MKPGKGASQDFTINIYIYIYISISIYIYITTGYGPSSVPYLIYVVEVRQGKSNDMGPAMNSPSFEHTYAL